MPKWRKLKIDQIAKIRPFFQSARHADSKNAKKFEKSLFFAEKTYKKSRNLSKFLFKKVTLMCIFLYLSFKKKCSICFKSSNLAFEGQKVALPLTAHCSPEYS